MFWVTDPDGERAGLLARPDPPQAGITGFGATSVGGSRGPAPHHAAGRPGTDATWSDWSRRTGSVSSSPSGRRSGALGGGAAVQAGEPPEEWRRRVVENAYSIPHVVGHLRHGSVTRATAPSSMPSAGSTASTG